MTVRVRCPSEKCAVTFDLEPERLGRNVSCPSCGSRMTARPAGVEARLRARELESAGGVGAGVPRLPLAVLVDNVRSLWNVGSIFRTADACGVELLVLTGIAGCPPEPRIAKTALGAERAVTWRYGADPRVALETLRGEGYTPVALESSPTAVSLETLEWPPRVCLVVGNEVSGVSPPVLEACPHHVFIPMRGIKESLNVAVAFGIAAYHAARRLSAAAAVVACATLLGPVAAEPTAPSPDASLPHTLGEVWYHQGGRAALGGVFSSSGDLTLTEEALEFVADKKAVRIPLDRIYVVSLGKMKGNKDTDWVVLALEGSDPKPIVGFRDGQKLGYGTRTREIYDAVESACQKASAAQFDVPPGFQTFDDLEDQLTLGLPAGWGAWIESLVSVGSRSPWGKLVFSAESIRSEDPDGRPRTDPRALAAVLGGEAPAVFLDRSEAGRGQSCERGFSDQATARLLARVASDPLLGPGYEVLEPPRAEAAALGGCAGVRIRAKSRRADGTEAVLDLRAARRGDTLFVLGVRALADRAEAFGRTFDQVVSTVRFSVAR